MVIVALPMKLFALKSMSKMQTSLYFRVLSIDQDSLN